MKKVVLSILLLRILLPITAQEQKKSVFSNMSLSGYIKYLNTVIFNRVDSTWLVDNLIHNRLNYDWRINDNITFSAGMRNRLIYGDLVKYIDNYKGMLSEDNGLLNFLTNNFVSGSSYVFNSTFDRAYIEYSLNKFVFTLGRQRINWGQAFAWNPNDIFNSYSFFDFDYEERAGSDALRVQYYPNYTSIVETAIKIDKRNNITAAALYRFNKWSYDIQFIAGIIDSSDYVIGSGWSGNIKNLGFNGEVSYFHPQENSTDSLGIVIFSVGLNYMFSNSLNVSIETNYNGFFNQIDINRFGDLYFAPLSVKTTSYSKFSWLAQISYPIHPLLNGSIAVMYLPSLSNGYFLMPSLSCSVCENLEFALYGQIFEGTLKGNYDKMTTLFMRFRYSF
ncbi:MAG: hypothetical protein MI739_01145 [Bacteroidales bacterium]|nr:hypothetical protein [Bacteroidales bacterium]